MFKPIAYLLLALLLAGCAQFNVTDNYKLSTERSNGLLVMSLFDTMSTPTVLNYRKLGSHSEKEDQAVMLGTIQEPADWHEPRGRLIAVEIPAGKYEFFSWSNGKSMQQTLVSVRPFSIPFTVTEGKATYIGSVLLNIDESKRTSSLTVTDQSDRDISLLLRKFKNIHNEEVIREITSVK